MDTKSYIVTDLAGPRVAGKVVKAGDKLTLTDAQASYELQLGTIAPVKKEAKPAPNNPPAS